MAVLPDSLIFFSILPHNVKIQLFSPCKLILPNGQTYLNKTLQRPFIHYVSVGNVSHPVRAKVLLLANFSICCFYWKAKKCINTLRTAPAKPGHSEKHKWTFDCRDKWSLVTSWLLEKAPMAATAGKVQLCMGHTELSTEGVWIWCFWSSQK